jgi:GNAT superfamily N-acetyltransferase
LDKGGKIIVAIQNGTVLGVCALVKMENSIYDFELAKMAVSQEARGKGIGYLLGKSIIETARSLGAKRIYLESNSVLEAALSLYQKLGFQDITDHQSPYSRCNVQMGLSL